MTKVGDIIYKFDENHRVYPKDANGRAHGGPIFEKHFVPFEIKGETPKSWIVGYENKGRVNKKTMKSSGQGGFHGHQWYTEKTKEDRIWRSEHRVGLERAMMRATTDQLKRIAEIIGYEG